MDSEDSHDGSGDANSSSSSSSSSSPSHRSSSSEKSKNSKSGVKSPPKSPPKSPSPPKSTGPRSPSPDSQSQSSNHSQSPDKPMSPDNLTGAHSDINSPENSMPTSPAGPTSPVGPRSPIGPTSPAEPSSPDAPKSPSDIGSNIDSPENKDQYSPVPPEADGPQSPKSTVSTAKSAPGSPEPTSRPTSPDAASRPTSPRNPDRSRSSSSSPDRPVYPVRSPVKQDWNPNEQWRRHTKAEQKIMVPEPRNRSRSESSQSSQSSSCNKQSSNKDPATEEISEGEMESDQEDTNSQSKSQSKAIPETKDLNISHEDLSDVSDLDSGNEEPTKETKIQSPAVSPEPKQEVRVNGNNAASTRTSPDSDSAKNDAPKLEKVPQEKTSNTEDGEEQLDFEAEEGECIEPKPKEQSNGGTEAPPQIVEKEETKPGRRTRGSSLEEGEVSDEGERRPEESEPRPICRFFSRGACTWGISCRFLHPGVTDKGNYSMFDVVRGVPPSGAYPPTIARDVPPPESAWERGLRTAKEMVRIANKRKEQDMDFEEKKLHLSVGGVVHDPDAELAYAAAAVGASPPHPHDMPLPMAMAHPHRDPDMYRPYGPPMYRGRGGFLGRPMVDERERYYERERVYERERPFERAPPPVYDERAPPTEEMAYHKRRVRPSREVIVQRAEVEQRREGRELREGRGEAGPREGRTRDGRGDEWADPWMRAENAARKRRPPSSEESYSSSSSHSSSRSSRSPGTRRKRRASSSSRQRISPTVIVRERRMATARATAMNPPAPRRRATSPAAARQLAVNPPPPANARHKDELDPYGRNKVPSRGRDRKKYSRSSSSGSESSTTSSDSESESHSSSSSGSSAAKRARHARLLNAAARPRMSAKTGLAAAVTIPHKKEGHSDKESSRKRSATSPGGDGNSKKSVSRREELLKQLKAVEDAIARKRSKV